MLAGALAGLAFGMPALALDNPLVIDVQPVGADGVHGNATLFQLGDKVDLAVNLDGNESASQAIDIRKGSCKSYAATAKWPLGASQETLLPNTKVESLLGNVLLIHKTADVSSPVVGCAEIKS
jgi:hypothetical protein